MAMMTGPILFGLPQAITSAYAAGIAISLAPYNSLGAELLAVADAYREVEPQTGLLFQRTVDAYRGSLRERNEGVVKYFQDKLEAMTKNIPLRQWSDIVEKLPPWATLGGFFATQPPKRHTYTREEIETIVRENDISVTVRLLLDGALIYRQRRQKSADRGVILAANLDLLDYLKYCSQQLAGHLESVMDEIFRIMRRESNESELAWLAAELATEFGERVYPFLMETWPELQGGGNDLFARRIFGIYRNLRNPSLPYLKILRVQMSTKSRFQIDAVIREIKTKPS